MTMPTVLDSILLRSLSRCSCFDTESLNLWDSGVDVDHGVLLKSQTDANHSKTGNLFSSCLISTFISNMFEVNPARSLGKEMLDAGRVIFTKGSRLDFNHSFALLGSSGTCQLFGLLDPYRAV